MHMIYSFPFAECLIASFAMIGLICGAFTPRPSIHRLIRSVYIVMLVAVAGLLSYQMSVPPVPVESFLERLFSPPMYSLPAKIVMCLAVAILIWQVQDIDDRDLIAQSEFPTLILIALTGLMLMISASDLLGVFLGLELTALPGYVLAAFRRNQLRSAEAGVKYVLLGAISTGLFIYGVSVVFGATGSTHYQDIQIVLQNSEPLNVSLLIGALFIFASIAFKIAAVPFHMWIPDVYEGAPNHSVTFFASAVKCGAIVLMVIICLRFFPGLYPQTQLLIQALAILSMVIGSIAALVQQNLKRMLAYSSIAHSGFLLLGLAAMTPQASADVLYYLIAYVIMALGAFSIITLMVRDDLPFSDIQQLAGSFKHHPYFAFALLPLFFSLIGVPPLGGFFAKFRVLSSALDAELYTLAVVGVLSSVIAAFYYLRVIKVVFFDKPLEPMDPMPKRTLTTLFLASLAMIVFAFFNQPLLNLTSQAGQYLFLE